MCYRFGILLCLCMISLTHARENPFVASQEPSGKTTQLLLKKNEFNSTKLTLPSSARVLKSVSVVFQNLDGSINEEVVGIDQDVDWHYPLVLSIQKPLLQEVPLSPAPAISTPKAPDKNSSKTLSVNVPPTYVQETTLKPAGRMTLDTGISIEVIDAYRIRIYTPHTKLRDFMVTAPYKIAIDFEKKGQNPFATKSTKIAKPPFISAMLGNHDGFYRIAITLDGHYRYDVVRTEDGYMVNLK